MVNWYKQAQTFDGERWFAVLKPEEQETIRRAFGEPWHQREYQEQVKWWANMNHELHELSEYPPEYDKYAFMDWWRHFKEEGVINAVEVGKLTDIAINRLAF